MAKETSKKMRWHKEENIDDGVLRHPSDSIEWKSFVERYPSFSSELRNVRLGLASDGFQPFGNMSSNHSIWPVVLVTYNLPPWDCMKDSYFMMPLLILGPKSPSNDIDVYLQPMIEKLKELWDGVETYDTHTKSNFLMCVALMWTINDFPAYGNLSGWSPKGKLACLCCHKDTQSISLRNKMFYMSHRRFLPMNHPWHKNRVLFDGKVEMGVAPSPLTGDEALMQIQELGNVSFGKGKKRKRNASNNAYNWRKKNLGIRQGLHPIEDGDTILLPAACYALSSQEKLKLCEFLANLKVPDAFSSNISREYMREMEIQGATRPQGIHNNKFIEWFRARESIFVLVAQGRATDEIISLDVSPEPLVHQYLIFMVNGFRFQTKELVRKTQNSGVLVRGDDADSNKEYYGVLEDIYELRYVRNRKVYLFKCHWWDAACLGRRYKIDQYGFTSVNTHCALNTNEPFVLASQSEQVFYLNDMIDKDWLVVVKTNPRDLFNMPDVEEEELINDEVYQQEEVECNILNTNDHETNIEVSLHRDDIEPETVLRTNDQENEEDDFINDHHTDESEDEESE
ncbi:hypothetical protein MTR67_026615 [Solanum verrucosum]|uniref:DUF4216 domain-containing protein n=1 Tax=Solanum verrucosum TaxID=315347 RepID=A0AAF0R2L5_SOLVR|nr:hypothetical protein MTR67_026615 [Solanum verrucosum]